jgi:hypothetical protein
VQSVPVATRSILRWRVVDAALIPREYYSLDEHRVSAAVRDGDAIPGIETYYEETVIAR